MSTTFLEKIATELDKAAEYIEAQERYDAAIKAEDLAVKKAEEDTKRSEMITPIKEKLSSIADEKEIDEKLKTASMEMLELISKGLSTTKTAESKVEDDWGNVDDNAQSKYRNGKGKYAGYRDPIEAFAMGD